MSSDSGTLTPTDPELFRHIDERTAAGLGRLHAAAGLIPDRLELTETKLHVARTLSPDKPEDVVTASRFARDAADTGGWAGDVADRLRKQVRIETPEGVCVRTAAGLIGLASLAADDLVRVAEELAAETRAVIAAAARLRGVIAPGAALTSEAERELYVLVRAELAKADPGKAGNARGEEARDGGEPEPVEDKGGKPAKKPPVSSIEANALVAGWLAKNVDPADLNTVRAATVRKINADTGVSLGQFRNLPAWTDFKVARDELLGARGRSRQLTHGMVATIPDRKAVDPAAEALANLIAEQEADERSDRAS